MPIQVTYAAGSASTHRYTARAGSNRPGQKGIMRIKKNDLTHWFIQDHATLPASYVKSCKEFFKSIKQQAPSSEAQASSSKLDKHINEG